MILDLVEAAVRTQRRDEAAVHVRAAQHAGIADVSARSALIVAGSAALAEPGDRARSRYEQVLAVPGAEAWPFDLARVRLAYGEHLRRSRATSAARLQLSAALAIFRRLGAGPWTARTESELRAAGHRTPGRAAPPRRRSATRRRSPVSLQRERRTVRSVNDLASHPGPSART